MFKYLKGFEISKLENSIWKLEDWKMKKSKN